MTVFLWLFIIHGDEENSYSICSSTARPLEDSFKQGRNQHTYTRICTYVYTVVKLKMGCGKDRCF